MRFFTGGTHLLAALALIVSATPAIGQKAVHPNFMAGVGSSPSIAARGDEVLMVVGTFTHNYSRDGGRTWQETDRIPWSGENPIPLYAICTGDSGRFYLAAPVQSFVVSGWSIEVFEGQVSGTRFVWRGLTNAVPLPFGDQYTAEPIELDLLFDPISRGLFLTFTNVRRNPLFLEEYQVTFVRSIDGGMTWDPPVGLTGIESAGGRPVVGPDGELTVVWENYALGKLMARRSDDFGASFGPEFEVSEIHDNVNLVPTSWTGGQRTNPVYPRASCMSAPAPFSLAVDRTNGPRRGTWYLVTAERATGTVGARTGVGSDLEPNDDIVSATPIEIGDVVQGDVRFTEYSYDDDWFTFVGEAGRTLWMNASHSMTPYVPGFAKGYGLRRGDDPATAAYVACFNTLEGATGPGAIYTLPSTGRYYISTNAPLGAIIDYVFGVYDFHIDPTSVARDHRDLLFSSSTDGGRTWTPKRRIGEGPIGNDESFPEVVVDEAGRVHVVWYDRRQSVAYADSAHTYWMYSEDGGITFSAPAAVSEHGTPTATHPSWPIGEHLGLATAGENVYVAWTRIRPEVEQWKQVWGAVIGDPIPPVPGGVNLSWDDCGAAGTGIKDFACDSNAGIPFTAIASFVPPPGITRFMGATASLFIGADGSPIPDWWQHGAGLCRSTTGLVMGYTFAEGPFTCREIGAGQAAGLHSYEVGYGGVNRVRLHVEYVVPEELQGPLDPDTEHYAFKVSLLKSKSTGSGSCSGCEAPMCLLLPSIQLLQPAELQYDPILSTPLHRNFVSWQGPAWVCDAATPVLVSVVTAEVLADGVKIVWHAEGVSDVAVYRRSDHGDWALQGRLRPDGSGRVAFVDREVTPGTYEYRLGVVVDGAEVYLGETAVTVPVLLALTLHGARRVGAVGGVVIGLSLASSAPATVELYDVAGRLWGTRRLEGFSAGRHDVSIHGSGRLSSGVYFVRLTQGARSTSQRYAIP